MTDYVAFSTANSLDEAKNLAHLAVELKLAACVQIVPQIISVYRWRREINEDKEFLLIIKTTKKCFTKLKVLWKKEHSYQVPELVAFEIKDGLDPYLEWLKESCVGGEKS